MLRKIDVKKINKHMTDMKFEGEPTEEASDQDTKYRELIKAAADFDALYRVIREIGVIRGSAKEYPAEKVIDDIERVRKDEIDEGFITRTYGLREKVEELLGVRSETV